MTCFKLKRLMCGCMAISRRSCRYSYQEPWEVLMLDHKLYLNGDTGLFRLCQQPSLDCWHSCTKPWCRAGARAVPGWLR